MPKRGRRSGRVGRAGRALRQSDQTSRWKRDPPTGRDKSNQGAPPHRRVRALRSGRPLQDPPEDPPLDSRAPPRTQSRGSGFRIAEGGAFGCGPVTLRRGHTARCVRYYPARREPTLFAMSIRILDARKQRCARRSDSFSSLFSAAGFVVRLGGPALNDGATPHRVDDEDDDVDGVLGGGRGPPSPPPQRHSRRCR